MRRGRFLGNGPQFWINLQSQPDIAVVEQERGGIIAQRVKPADVV